MKKVEEKKSPELSTGYVIFCVISGIILLVAVGFTVRMCVGVEKNPQHTIGIVTTTYSNGFGKYSFDYVYAVDGVLFEHRSSFYKSDDCFIRPGDTVYVTYEKGWPDNAILKTKRPSGGNPIYSKCIDP